MEYEYKAVEWETFHCGKEITNKMNDLAVQGWEYINSVVDTTISGRAIFVFRRKK